MTKTLIFKTVATDSVIIRPGQDPLFVASPPSLERVTTEPEGPISRWLLDLPIVRSLIYEELGLAGNWHCWFQVQKPVVPDPLKKPGDIDVMLCRRDAPNLTVAFQCKRAKVLAKPGMRDSLYWIQNVGHGVEQANAQREMGFRRNYLAVLIVVAGMMREETNVFFRGVTPKGFQRIYDLGFRDALHEDVGIVFIEIVQPSSKSIHTMSVVGVCIDRPAKPLEQPAKLTNRIAEFVRFN